MNKFNPKKTQLYVDGCSYTCEVNFGVSFNCESCDARNVHTTYSELTLTEYDIMEAKIQKYQKTQTWTYKTTLYIKNLLFKLTKIKFGLK